MTSSVSIPDYELFKNKQYELILQKYQPMIYSISKKFSHLNDNSIDFDDIIQENMIVAWFAIEYAQQRIKNKKTTFNDKLYFGPMLKQRLTKYSMDRLQKQNLQINQRLDSIFSDTYDRESGLKELKELKIKDNFNFTEQLEEADLYWNFIKLLSTKERKLLLLMEKFKTCNKVSKKMSMSYTTTAKNIKNLKNKYQEFIHRDGYNLN
jgi:hypothetical protein